MSETIVGIFVGLLATVITNIVSIWMTTKDRKLNEKMNYHKLGIEHLLNKITQLNKWNVDFRELLKVRVELLMIEKFKHEEMLVDLNTSIASLNSKLFVSINQLSIYLSEDRKTSVNDLLSEYTKNLVDTSNKIERAKIELETIEKIHSIVMSEINDNHKTIDSLVKKYLE